VSAVDWREEALIARAALYLLKVATARPDLPRLDAWIRAHVEVTTVMDHGYPGERMGDPEWEDLDWRRDTLAIMIDHSSPQRNLGLARNPYAPPWPTFRARVLALLDGP
jgi:hypothetical protein